MDMARPIDHGGGGFIATRLNAQYNHIPGHSASLGSFADRGREPKEKKWHRKTGMTPLTIP
jgi:hypothetical protein